MDRVQLFENLEAAIRIVQFMGVSERHDEINVGQGVGRPGFLAASLGTRRQALQHAPAGGHGLAQPVAVGLPVVAESPDRLAGLQPAFDILAGQAEGEQGGSYRLEVVGAGRHEQLLWFASEFSDRPL